MNVCGKHQSDCLEVEEFLTYSYASKEKFIKQYQRFCNGKKKTRELYLLVLSKLEKAIIGGNIDDFKKFDKLIEYISNVENPNTLKIHFNDKRNPIKTTNLIILACKHDKLEILKFILNNNSVLDNLCTSVRENAIAPSDKDEECHDAFYYAIRSNNLELLHTLIKSWPNDYFALHSEELDEMLSKAYEELKLKNVPLSEEIEIFVENKLINLRFFSTTSGSTLIKLHEYRQKIRDRVALLLENITLLNIECSSTEEVNDTVLFILKFIALHIHILKRQLKSTYDILPWEEIEFCVASFVSSYARKQELNLFYRAVLNKKKILTYLRNFGKILEKNVETVICLDELTDFPKLKREEIIANIIDNCPEFEELYIDYQQICDVHSLDRIKHYVKLTSEANPEEKEGQLVIMRALQIMGEYLNNSLESPKLSNNICDLLLLSLPKQTRKVVIDLRNSLSRGYSLYKRIEIEENSNIHFFTSIQNHIGEIGDVIAKIFFTNKIKMMRTLLKKIINSKNSNEMKGVLEILENTELNETNWSNFMVLEYQMLEERIDELNDTIFDKTYFEEQQFKEIYSIINSVKANLQLIGKVFLFGFIALNDYAALLTNRECNNASIFKAVRLRANDTLKNMTYEMEDQDLIKILKSFTMILYSARLRQINEEKLDKFNGISNEIFYIIQHTMNDVSGIKKFEDKLGAKSSFVSVYKRRKTRIAITRDYDKLLVSRLSELKNILTNNELSDQMIDEILFYTKNKWLQAVIEMLMLDIMLILDISEGCLENNQFFLDDSSIPFLSGKRLLNYLALDNNLAEILLSDPVITVISNAKKLISENIINSEKNIGKSAKNGTSLLKDKFHQDFITISNQAKLFAALEEGNLEEAKNCLKKGADIKARNLNLWTALHFAAKGSNLEVTKFILDQGFDFHVEDKNGQSPLHIAAEYGNETIVKFFVEEMGIYVDESDIHGRTPLCIAAKNGHKSIVEILLKNNSNGGIIDLMDFSPLSYAVNNNHIDIVKILLTKTTHIDIHQTNGGFTILHIAAKNSFLELVHLLLKNKVNVNVNANAKIEIGTPLHVAALNGHLEVVKALILKGADINSKNGGGWTALHYAVERGHEEMVLILLKHGVKVNIADKREHNTPLHNASRDGYEKIVEILLQNKANANAITVDGMTPLHFAVRGGHLKIVIALIKRGVNIHAKDRKHDAPLHYAAEYGHVEIAELLIRNEAEINDTNCLDETPLHIAAKKGNEDIVALLIKNDAHVNARNYELYSPLHAAAESGNRDTIELLINNKAEVDARTIYGTTSLHLAAEHGQVTAVDCLLKNKAKIKANVCGFLPLHLAVRAGHKDIVKHLIENDSKIIDDSVLQMAIKFGHKEIVEILLENGANANFGHSDHLYSAVVNNENEILKVLIRNEANISAEGKECLKIAVLAGYKDIVETLLKNEVSINMKVSEGNTSLYLASGKGHKKIVELLLKKGADVNSLAVNGSSPLHIAAQKGFEEVAEILIAYEAKVNIVNSEGTPLHLAAEQGHDNVVEVLLWNGANIHIKNGKNEIPLELAVALGHLNVVKMLLRHKKTNMNNKGNYDCTLLHIAALNNNLEMVKYLVNEGSDINARNASNSKPIHIAAREGNKQMVKFFISKGSSINELGNDNQTLMHYAAMKGRIEVLEYLIAQGADINARDINGITPMHMASNLGEKKAINILLKNGAIYNSVDKTYRSPLIMTKNKAISYLLTSIHELFSSVKQNDCLKVKASIEAGVIVNAKSADGGTPLHYAAWKGFDRVVKILLENKINPNAIDNKGLTALHYASKFSHVNTVKILLSSGALYNAVSISGKTPLDFAINKNIIRLFQLISDSFKKVEDNDAQIICDLSKIKDIDIVKAIMNARNKENMTLVVFAMHCNFSNIEKLKETLQDNISFLLTEAALLFNLGDYQGALDIYECILKKRKEIFGLDNPATLDIQILEAKIFYMCEKYEIALIMLENISRKQEEILGSDDQNTLNTKSKSALVLHRLERNDEAYKIFREVYRKQKETLGPDHLDTLETLFHMALVLDTQGKYEEALKINETVFRIRKKILGMDDINTVAAQNNIAMVLSDQGKYNTALKICKDVLRKKKMILGINHLSTLRTLNIMGTIYLKKRNYDEAMKSFQKVLRIQKKNLPPNHSDIFKTEYNIATTLRMQGKFNNTHVDDRMEMIFGSNHFTFSDWLEDISAAYLRPILGDNNIKKDDFNMSFLRLLIDLKMDLGNNDNLDGTTPLHHAVNSGNAEIVKSLLQRGADVTQITKKGNTPLHIAVFKNYQNIVEILLQSVDHDRLHDFINAKTVSSGTTSLHVAAKNGSFEVVKCLLKYGASYGIKNKEGKAPIDLSENVEVSNLLKLIEELFQDAKKGNIDIINKLKLMKYDEFLAAMNACNNLGHKLSQVCIINKHKYMAINLLEMLKIK